MEFKEKAKFRRLYARNISSPPVLLVVASKMAEPPSRGTRERGVSSRVIGDDLLRESVILVGREVAREQTPRSGVQKAKAGARFVEREFAILPSNVLHNCGDSTSSRTLDPAPRAASLPTFRARCENLWRYVYANKSRFARRSRREAASYSNLIRVSSTKLISIEINNNAMLR